LESALHYSKQQQMFPLLSTPKHQGKEMFTAVVPAAAHHHLFCGTARLPVAAAKHTIIRVNQQQDIQLPALAATGPHHWPAVFGELPRYGGRCTLCGGSHFLPCTQQTVEAMQQELDAIRRQQRLDYDSPGDPRFQLDYLFTLGPGRMLGVLCCFDAQGQQHVLKAFSGQITESWYIPGGHVGGA
jgi:hypothetical protein